MMAAPPQETRQVLLITEHMRRFSQIPEHFRTVKVLKGGNRKDTKTKKSKKKKQVPKHSAFANMINDDPRSVKLAISLEFQEKSKI
jgi:hypothetical protein